MSLQPQAASPDLSTRSGSHAGRGFRFQDAASAWLAVRSWAGIIDYGGVVPEGLDDAELRGPSGSTFVQIKPRREHLGPYAPSDVAVFVRDLWKRAEAAKAKPTALLLIVERPIEHMTLSAGVAEALSAADRVGRLVATHGLARRWMDKTQLLICGEPSTLGASIVAERLGVLPIVAATCFAAITAKIGMLAEDNGLEGAGTFKSLSIADATRTIDDLVGVLSAIDLEPAVAQGLCEAVDFTTPMPSDEFYLGTDVQPGHIAAGLLVERPDARERVLNALQSRRAVLITGPSGSGKSGLMWQAARATRHTIRWFRVRNATEGDVAALLRLAVTYRATAFSPIGFVVDDVGRSRAGLWDALVDESRTAPGVFMLGSLRQEDMFLVKRRSLTADLYEAPDDDLAERLWRALDERGQTTQPFWKEPWIEAKGLLLEYAYLLTQGRRLSDVLREQIGRRIDEDRQTELDILRVASAAGQTGAIVDLERLRQVLGRSASEISTALRRLVEEHLVQSREDGRIGSLHQIRARTISELTHEVPPPTLAQSVTQAMVCVTAEDVEGFIARSLSLSTDLAEALVDAAIARWRVDGGLPLLAAILRGFAAGDIERTIRRWLSNLSDLPLAKTQVTQALTFALADMAPFLTEKLADHFTAAERFKATPHVDHRVKILEQVDGEVAAILALKPSWLDVVALLEACLDLSPPSKTLAALHGAEPSFAAMPLEQTTELLEAARLIDPSLAKAWSALASQAALLDQLTLQSPWVSVVSLESQEDGLAVSGMLFHISDEVQPNLHEDVVELCRKALALAPDAELAVFAARDPNGQETGLDYPIASKRIPRANLPARAVPLRNRQWIRAAAQTLAPFTVSQYLAKAAGLLDQLVPALEALVDGIVRGKADQSQLDTLGAVFDASKEMTCPVRPDGKGGETGIVGVPDLQNIINQCAAEAPRWLIYLPEAGAARYKLLQDLILQIDKVTTEEPWDLIVGGPPQSLDRLRTLLVQLATAVGAATARGLKIHQFAPASVLNAGAGKALQRLSAFLEPIDRQSRADLERHLRGALRARGFNVTAHARPTTTTIGPWPYSEMVVVVDIVSDGDWSATLLEVAGAAREILSGDSMLTVMPAIGGRSVPAWSQSILQRVLPMPFDDEAWLARVGRPPLRLALTGLLDGAMGALLTLSAITAFNCATADRHPLEAETQSVNVRRLSERQTMLASTLQEPLAQDIVAILDALASLGGQLAVDFYDLMGGAMPPSHALLERFGQLKAELTILDLAGASQS